MSLIDDLASETWTHRRAVPFKGDEREELRSLGIDPDAWQFGLPPPAGWRWETDAEFRDRLKRTT